MASVDGANERLIPADLPNGEIFEQAVVLLELPLESLEGDRAPVALVRVLEQGHRQFLDLLVAEAHPVLLHAGTQHVLEFSQLNEAVTCARNIGPAAPAKRTSR
jgi:hypothetical protein